MGLYGAQNWMNGLPRGEFPRRHICAAAPKRGVPRTRSSAGGLYVPHQDGICLPTLVKARLPAPGTPEADVVASARADENVARHVEDKTERRVIYVEGRLVNFVVS